MKYDLTSSFIKDVKKSPLDIQSQVKALIGSIEAVERLSDWQHVKKMTGFSDAYRIRLGEYRVGI
jgi:mRNA interferase RelE/StbE